MFSVLATFGLASAITIISGCATSIPSKQVTLVGADNHIYEGTLAYSGPYSGVLSISGGPGNESFTGRYVVVDKTSTSSSKGSMLIPSGTNILGMGSMASIESGALNTQGFWYGQGNKGSQLKCVLSVGIGGHGTGLCEHTNKSVYDILL